MGVSSALAKAPDVPWPIFAQIWYGVTAIKLSLHYGVAAISERERGLPAKSIILVGSSTLFPMDIHQPLNGHGVMASH
jgi:hypothetical protein